VEYAAIVALVAGVVIATVTIVGGQVLDLFESVIGSF
jgi:Flp pilus assembly pilin Flp